MSTSKTQLQGSRKRKHDHSSGITSGENAQLDIDSIFSNPSKLTSTNTVKTDSPGSSSSRKINLQDGLGAIKSAKSKGKKKAIDEGSIAVSGNDDISTKKKKKSKQSNSLDASVDESVSKSKSIAKTSEVIEVVDTSSNVLLKPQTDPGSLDKAGKVKKKDRKEVEEDRLFRDSRGDSDRRKTEEGFFIFKEAELGINPEAGGTPLCPFDCECCE